MLRLTFLRPNGRYFSVDVISSASAQVDSLSWSNGTGECERVKNLPAKWGADEIRWKAALFLALAVPSWR
ncbi:MAG: hypothetical protein U0894_00455 [Pirellulales bacterium]